MRHAKLTLPVILSFMKIFVAQTSSSFFSSIVEKLNISLIYEAIIVIFSVSLPMVNLNKFCKREILIQLPGEPREQHLGDVRPKKFKLHKIS